MVTVESSGIAELIVGTASLGGLEYGYSEAVASEGEIARVLSALGKHGVTSVDTAPAYGRAEEFLGKYLSADINVYSKVDLRSVDNPQTKIRDSVTRTLQKLGRMRLSGLTLHGVVEPSIMKRAFGLFEELKAEGTIGTWGVSVYTPRELHQVLDIDHPDYIQAPVNLLDRRFIHEDQFSRMKELDCRLQARSPLLQGLLANRVKLRPCHLPLKPYVDSYEDLSASRKMSLADFALNFVRGHSEVSQMVVGVASTTELEALALIRGIRVDDAMIPQPSKEVFQLLDPRNWSDSKEKSK